MRAAWVNPALLAYAPAGCTVYNSAEMTLEQVLQAIRDAEAAGVDNRPPAHRRSLPLWGHPRADGCAGRPGHPLGRYPGVSSFCAAAAALGAEYTLPGVSQSLIITRMAGRTPVPAGEDLTALASHGCSMVLFLSGGTAG